MARDMFKSYGEPGQYIRNAYSFAPTTLYKGEDCRGIATAVPVASWREDEINTWQAGALADRNMDNAARSVMVPPGFRLALFGEEVDQGDAYVVLGQMRQDGKGPRCHNIDAAFAEQASALRLMRKSAHVEEVFVEDEDEDEI